MAVRQSRLGKIWKRITKNWFQLTIGLVGILHGWAIVTKQIDLTTAGGSLSTFITAIALIKNALKDEDAD
jgi:hypothetical protein